MNKDYYKLLGVSKDASPDDIKKAYRKLAKEYHPDRCRGDKAKSEKFKEMSEAYNVLSDPQKKQEYDMGGQGGFGSSGFGGGSGFNNFYEGGSDAFSEMFESFFGGSSSFSKKTKRNTGSNVRVELQISLEDAFYGKQAQIKVPMKVQCYSCDGTHSSSKSESESCSNCNGKGHHIIRDGFFTIKNTCSTCHGEGSVIKNPCRYCDKTGRTSGHKVTVVDVKPGCLNNDVIVIKGKGEDGVLGGKPGDMEVVVLIKKHPLFERKGNDLYISAEIPMVMAAKGGEINVSGIDNNVKVKIPAGSQYGDSIKISEKGMPYSSKSRGNLYVDLKVKIQKAETQEQKDLLEKFDKLKSN